VQWFNKELVRKVRVGSNTFFLKDPWVSNVPLMEAFPRLYSIVNSQDGMASDFYVRNAEGEGGGCVGGMSCLSGKMSS